MNYDNNLETITLGGGCFWCLEAVFERLNGVVEVVSGYSGGHVPEPDYRMVCSGSTGHAENYHHNYFEKNPYQGYCQMVIAPKLRKFQAEFDTKLKDT